MADNNELQEFLDLAGLEHLWVRFKEKLNGKANTRVARKVVGTSANGWTAADCDYLCDGTADEVEINAAINALPETGGEVILLDGTYTIAAQIKVGVANVTLRGNGNGTTIVRGFDASRMIYVSYSNVTVEKLKLDGAKATYTDTSNHGIYSLAAKTTVRNCTVADCAGDGIYLSTEYGKAIGNTVTGCASGIYASGEQCILSNNILLENDSYGLSIQDNHIVATCNIAKLNGTANMYMFYALNCTITGNDFSVIDGDSVTPKAIYLYGSYSDDNIIVNNQVGVGTVDGGSGTGNIVGTALDFMNRSNAVDEADTNYTTLMARGTSLNSAATTPAVNGAIAWQYE